MSYPELAQLELNIQLLYIKLPSYYELIANSEAKKVAVRKARNAFAHELTDLMFNKRVKYNFFLHKVAENFKKVQFIFYEEDNEGSEKEVLSKTFDLELDKDINNFLAIWSQTRQKIDITEKVKIPALHPKTEKPS